MFHFCLHFFVCLHYRLTNGASSGDANTAMMWMMGATLNTSSSAAAKEMDLVMKSEIATHSAYETRPSYHGVPLPGKKQVCTKNIIHFTEFF